MKSAKIISEDRGTDLSKFKDISENLLRDGFDVRITGRGSSMIPYIMTGDNIVISPDRNIQPGDIILFKRGDQLVCHRLARIFEKEGIVYYQTRGDSRFSLDDPIRSNTILGKVVRIERKEIPLRRRALLLIYPVLRWGMLNAAIISILCKIRNFFYKTEVRL